MVERMQKHVSSSLKKLSGKTSIRKQSETDPSRDPSKSNAKKISRIKNPERKASKTIMRQSSKRKTLKELSAKKRVKIASPDHSICSQNSAPPLRISREETSFRKIKRIRKATSPFVELASETDVDDEIGVKDHRSDETRTIVQRIIPSRTITRQSSND